MDTPQGTYYEDSLLLWFLGHFMSFLRKSMEQWVAGNDRSGVNGVGFATHRPTGKGPWRTQAGSRRCAQRP